MNPNPKYLIMNPDEIDKLIISPTRDKSIFSSSEWRNKIASAMSFKDFSEMKKNELVLIEKWDALGKFEKHQYQSLDKAFMNAAKWYVPSTFEGNLCIAIDKNDYMILPSIHEDDGRGLYASGVEFIPIGNICLSKNEAGRLIEKIYDDLNNSTIEMLYQNNYAEEFGVPRGHLLEYWYHTNMPEDKKKLLECDSKKKLYAAICDHLGPDAEDDLAQSFGCSIEDFILLILNDENSKI